MIETDFYSTIAATGNHLQYYFSNDSSNQQGPADIDGLKQAGITPATLVWREGMPNWTPAGEVAELATIFENVTPGSADYASNMSAAYTPEQAQPARQQKIEYQTPVYTSQSSNGMAVVSLVLGIVGLMTWCAWCIGFVPAVLAIIFGHIARGQIRRGQGLGDGMALAGLILGYITIAILVTIIAFVSISGYISSTNALTPRPPIAAPVIPNPGR